MTDIPGAMRGAVDLAALAAQSRRADTGLATIDEEAFQELAQQSMQRPVVIAFVSSASPQSEELARTVEEAAAALGVTAAACDVDAQPAIAQAFQIRGVPAAVAIIGGRPAPLFQGAATREQIDEVLGQVVAAARQMGAAEGLTEGSAAPAPEPEPPLPPLHQEAYDAIERGDLEAAEAAYDRALRENPKDADARAGRSQVRLMARSRTADLGAVRKAAADAPDDVDAQLAVADMDVLGGQLDDAFGRLVDLVRVTVGDDREKARARLLELFDVVDAADPRVLRARQALASALY
ncbi:co-chaperone YbbN [Demequina mangrovi]|uniref:Putative thioredoxin n=1 Tax=Demequina mangrovi TaxID=1043493 RepID=A0A1H6X1F5_9MICO|nr:tetratricopeptide repeat protein [Demequina mangrovi]SEJ22838.1 putative thioredoxin [Demequina mangrovi]